MPYRDLRTSLEWRQRQLEMQLVSVHQELSGYSRLCERQERLRRELAEVRSRLAGDRPRRSWKFALAGAGAAVVVGGAVFSQIVSARTCRASPGNAAWTAVHSIREVATVWKALEGGSVCPTMFMLIHRGELDPGEHRVDAWGAPHLIECRGDDITVRSAGPDGRYRTVDDIVAGPRARSSPGRVH